MRIEEEMEKQRIILPSPSKSLGSYVTAVKTGSFVYLSGVVPMRNGKVVKGKFGKEFDIENGKEIAELCALQLIASLKSAINDLDRVKQIVQIQGFINSTDKFTEQSKVMNTVSDLFVRVFGEKGKHTRIAIGVNTLPSDAAMEVSLVAEI
jgi:enamine deaminase RidA (YjgF/YER057c/UK114 family)